MIHFIYMNMYHQGTKTFSAIFVIDDPSICNTLLLLQNLSLFFH